MPGASTTVSFELNPEHLAMVDADGHVGLHAGKFGVVFSRGHGVVLEATAEVTASSAPANTRMKTFRRWW
jgi:hypothetical protein